MVLRTPAFLHAFGAVKGPADQYIMLKAVAPEGAVVEARVAPRTDGAKGRTPVARVPSWLEREAATHNYGQQSDLQEDGRNYLCETAATPVLYMSLDRMGSDDFGKPFDAFEKEAVDALTNTAASRLIIDLRRNGGGDNMLAEPLRKFIQRSRFNRPGAIVVLIAPHTFSAAQNFANRLERETFALFVGQPTGSAPNHCGDAKRISADVSTLPAQVSTVRWMDSAPLDHRTTIMPDLLVPATFTDFVNGRDAAFESAMIAVDDRPFDDSLLTAPWERTSQSVTWRPFWA
jgi:hypothetical protein